MDVIDDVESGKLKIEITQSICKLDDVVGIVKVQDKAKAELLRLAKIGKMAERLGKDCYKSWTDNLMDCGYQDSCFLKDICGVKEDRP